MPAMPAGNRFSLFLSSVSLIILAGSAAVAQVAAPGSTAEPSNAAEAAVSDAVDAAKTAEGKPETAAPVAIDTAGLRKAALDVFAPLPKVAPLPHDKKATPERISLGAMLYFDPRMSRSQLISCQTCHNIGMGGIDGMETSIGHDWQKGPRNAPTVLNAVLNVAQFWDGRAEDFAAQAKGPVQAGVEMNNSPDNVLATLKSMPGYVDAFKAAFPDSKEPVDFDNFAHAIEAFEATLLTPNAPFDQFLNGDDAAMSDQQKRGLQTFMDVGCSSCHMGVNVGGQDYFPFGVATAPSDLVRPASDEGRAKVTKSPDDKFVFRAAPLRNIALTAPYFHTGTVWDLKEAVSIMSDSQLGTEMTPEQVDDVVAFLGALTGDQPVVAEPVLPPRGPDTPKPDPDYKVAP